MIDLTTKIIEYRFKKKAIIKASEGGSLYQVLIEKDAEFKPIQYNNLFDSLYTIYHPDEPRWVSFEYRGTPGGIGIYMWASEGVSMDLLQSNINSVHPAAEVHPADDYTQFYGKILKVANFELESHFIFPLLQSDGERAGADVMTSLCASMQNLSDGEEVMFQAIIRPVHYRALAIGEAFYQIYKDTGRRGAKLTGKYAHITPWLADIQSARTAMERVFMGTAGKKAHNFSLQTIQNKLQAGIFFDLTVRAVTIAKTPERAQERLNVLISAIAPTTDKNRLKANTELKIGKYVDFLEAYRKRTVSVFPLENYVTPSELATMLHFPSRHIPGVVRLRSKKLPVPDGIAKYNTIAEAWADGAIVFGVSHYRGKTKYLAFRDIRMLMQHAYIIGATGSGKSYLLACLALQIIKHTGLTFFDVKGDIVDFIMRYLPKEEWHRIVYIDLQTAVWYLPFNILRQPAMSAYNLSSMIVSVFLKVFGKSSIQAHSQNVLRQALLAVISTDPEGSLLEVYRMFTDEHYLDRTIVALEHGEYPDVLAYWKSFKRMKHSARKSEAGAIVNKLQTITQNERPRYTLCQRTNALNWRKLLDSKAVILVNLSFGQNEPEILSFFGTILTAFITKATFSRDDTKEANRVPHVFILDEFERFCDQDADMKKFLEMSRSYGLGMVLAHQSVEQIPADLMGMIADNTFTQISLNIGTGSSTAISKMFPEASPEDLEGLDVYQAFGRFKKLHPAAFTFSTLDVTEIFEDQGEQSAQKFKDEFRRKHYKRLSEIKDDINSRYRLVEANQRNEDDSPKVHGNASGKIRREETQWKG